jgi:hypothetical protein
LEKLVVGEYLWTSPLGLTYFVEAQPP